MEFREFIGKNLKDLVNENKARPANAIDSDRYKELSKDKGKVENLQNLLVNIKDVIRSKTELLDVTKRVFELNNIVDSEKLVSAEKIEGSLFTIISDLNIDLELADAGSSEEEAILQSLGVAYYIYEEFLYPIITTKPKEKLQTPDEWVDAQRREYIKIKASLKSDLEMANLFGKSLSAEERAIYGPRWISAIQPLLSQANEQIEAFPTEIAYSNWKTELIRAFNDVTKDWNLEEIKQKRREDVDLMKIEDIVDEVINLEIPFYDPEYAQNENNEYKVALVEKIRWRNFDEEKKEWIGLGWEDYAALTGQASNPKDEKFEQTFNSLERRELVVKLQVAALEAMQLRRKGFAEGDRSKLFENLTKAKLNREQLLLATTCHPRYGEYLTKILKIAQEMPILRKGKLPKEIEGVTTFPVKFVVNGKEFSLDRSKELKESKTITIDDRVVLRKSKDGFLPVLLRGDIYWKTSDPNDKNHILNSGFIPAEMPKDDDKLLYKFNGEYTYETLSSDTGRPTRDRMITDIAKMINDDPERFDLTKEDLPNEEDQKKANWFAGKLFYSFPFLSYILAKRKETTQTDSHNADLEEDINWMLVFSPLGHAIHSSQRYGAANVAWMWLLPYYPELQEGHYGASGDAKRLNDLRDLMIKHQECFFDTNLFAGQVFAKKEDANGQVENKDVLLPPFGASEFLSPLDIITPSPKERIALKGNGVGRKNVRIVANPREPVYLKYGGKEINEGKGINEKIETKDDAKAGNDKLRSFDLCKTAISGWLSFLKKTLEGMSAELEDEEIVGGVGEKKAILGQLMGDSLGKAKMFFTEKEEWKNTELESFDHMFGVARPILWHLIERTFYAYAYGDKHSRKALFAKALEAVSHDMTKGGLSSDSAAKMTAWIYQTMKGIDEKVRYGEDKDFKGMNRSLAPPDINSWGNRREKVFEYLKALWDWKKKTSEEGATVYGEFPLLNNLGMLKPNIFVTQRANPQPHITHFQAMMRKEEELELPVTRSGLKTDSSKKDKE